MKKNVLALSIAAMIGGLGFARETEASYSGFTIMYCYPSDIQYGRLAMEFL